MTSIEALKNVIAKHGDKAAIFPIHRLQEIRQDLDDLKNSGVFNKFQHFIVNDLYDLDIPATRFEARSVIIIASPSPSAIELTFTRNGKQIPLTLVGSYPGKDRIPVRLEASLKAFLNPQGYDVFYAPQLPRKRIAVRSGLAQYGRNNICYVEGMGSFLNLTPFFTDIPCEEDTWREVQEMDRCRDCKACLRSCPTGAIRPDRFLIDNERCLPYFNEGGSEWDFPGWMEPSAHHTLYGCLRCQTTCPANQSYLNTVRDPEVFTEAETQLLLDGAPFESFSEHLQQKVKSYEMVEYLGALPRNMRALFQNAA